MLDINVKGLRSSETAKAWGYLGPVPLDDLAGECLCLFLIDFRPRHFSKGELVEIKGVEEVGLFRVHELRRDRKNNTDSLFLERVDGDDEDRRPIEHLSDEDLLNDPLTIRALKRVENVITRNGRRPWKLR